MKKTIILVSLILMSWTLPRKKQLNLLCDKEWSIPNQNIKVYFDSNGEYKLYNKNHTFNGNWEISKDSICLKIEQDVPDFCFKIKRISRHKLVIKSPNGVVKYKNL